MSKRQKTRNVKTHHIPEANPSAVWQQRTAQDEDLGLWRFEDLATRKKSLNQKVKSVKSHAFIMNGVNDFTGHIYKRDTQKMEFQTKGLDYSKTGTGTGLGKTFSSRQLSA